MIATPQFVRCETCRKIAGDFDSGDSLWMKGYRFLNISAAKSLTYPIHVSYSMSI
jgi:hypothetical protein